MSTLKVDQVQTTGARKILGPDGCILQVQSTEKTDVWSTSGWSEAEITGMNLSITPSSSSHKVLVYVKLVCSSNYYVTYANVKRGNTTLGLGTGAGNRPVRTLMYVMDGSGTNSHGFVHHQIYYWLDSPNTTSSVNYKCYGWGRGSSNVMYVNRSTPDRNTTEYDGRYASQMMLFEVSHS